VVALPLNDDDDEDGVVMNGAEEVPSPGELVGF
jgi:hypothetical protein